MSTRLYFDLEAVADQARHAILADLNATPGAAYNDAAGPGLFFYRSHGRVRLASNGSSSHHRDVPPVCAQPRDALTTPAVRPPSRRNAAVIPLLDPHGRSWST